MFRCDRRCLEELIERSARPSVQRLLQLNPAAARPLLLALCWGVPDRDGRGEEHRRNRQFSPAGRFKT